MKNRNRKARHNGRRAEILLKQKLSLTANGREIIDYPDHPDFGELKSVETERRNDKSGYRRITIERNQVETLKRTEKLLLVYVHETKRLFAVHPVYLNGNRKVSWHELAETGSEIEI